MYNIEKATKSLINTGAFLAKDLHYDPERIPDVNKVENWHEGAMILLHLCQGAHKEIKRLKADKLKTMELMADVEYGLDEWNYPIGTKQNVEKMCDDFFGKGVRPDGLNNLPQAITAKEIEPMMNLGESNQHGRTRTCLGSALIYLLGFLL